MEYTGKDMRGFISMLLGHSQEKVRRETVAGATLIMVHLIAWAGCSQLA